MTTTTAPDLATLSDDRAEHARELYRSLHAAPELSGRERETSARALAHLRAAGAGVRARVGGHGVVGVLRNGEGPVVAVRAELDALAVLESTGLPYASSRRTTLGGRQVGVSHACGHDVHVAALLTAVEHLAAARDAWAGTLVAILEPDEESGRGAAAMLADGLARTVPRPDVLLAQHVSPDPLGAVTIGAGAVLSSSVALALTLHGTGGHVAFADDGVDTVAVLLDVLAAAGDLAREAGAELTVSAVHGGASHNTLPHVVRADLVLRGADAHVLGVVADEVGVLARHLADRAGCPRPAEVERVASFGDVRNEPRAAQRVHRALVGRRVPTYVLTRPSPASDDVGALARGLRCPLVYWFLGVSDPALVAEAALDPRASAAPALPGNHAPDFAPHPDAVVHATRALLVAAGAWLAR
ncbi:M20/M25/M40 family metallo-hydrolase [Cellulomonas sp. CW35]|uniref:M20/M25/M40 family metallo-hydrolase n=1 Tax=Cellulomonas sp. CW35 TaxID=3458249 RepID=UPI004033E843